MPFVREPSTDYSNLIRKNSWVRVGAFVCGEVAPTTLFQGPRMFVADSSAPNSQLKTKPYDGDWTDNLSGGFTITVVLATEETQVPIKAITL